MDRGRNNKFNRTYITSCVVFFAFLTYLFFCFITECVREGVDGFLSRGFFYILNPANAFNAEGLTITTIFLTATFAVVCVFLVYVSYMRGRIYKSDYDGIEQGEAMWLVCKTHKDDEVARKVCPAETAKNYSNKMMSQKYEENIMFDNEYGLSTNTFKTQRNLHMLVVGGSGAGKTRYFIKPNVLQMNQSYIITDPSGELYRDMGDMLRKNGYDVRVFNTFNVNNSMQYNPLAYISEDSDVTSLVTTLIKNTGEAKGDNKYFDDATKLLLTAIILFLFHYCPKSEHNFSHVMRLVVAADVPADARNPVSDLDRIFNHVREVDPHGLAVRMYNSFKSTSGKSLKSVLSSTATRLTVFNYSEIERLTCDDTISLTTVGDEKTVLFIITPPTDNGFDFLVAMMYSQLFLTLYRHDQFECHYLLKDNDYIARPFKTEADALRVKKLIDKQKANPGDEIIRFDLNKRINKYDLVDVENDKVLMTEIRECVMKKLVECPEKFVVEPNGKDLAGSPFPVRLLMDEFANITEIPDFLRVLSTSRKYRISVVIVLQALSQLKKNYEKDYEAIIGNCDTFVFLGANDSDTAKYVSEKLGNMTITVKSRNKNGSKGGSGYNQTKRELMTAHELTMLPNDKQIVILRGYYPFYLDKFKLEKHPNIDKSADGKEGKTLIISEELDLKRKYEELKEEEDVDLDDFVDNEEQKEKNDRNRKDIEQWMRDTGVEGKKGERSRNDDFF